MVEVGVIVALRVTARCCGNAVPSVERAEAAAPAVALGVWVALAETLAIAVAAGRMAVAPTVGIEGATEVPDSSLTASQTKMASAANAARTTAARVRLGGATAGLAAGPGDSADGSGRLGPPGSRARRAASRSAKPSGAGKACSRLTCPAVAKRSASSP